jgi:hypothetical protein
MARRQQTETEKAQTAFTDIILDNPYAVKDLEKTLKDIERYFQFNPREAACAVRDYAQLQVAKHMDAAFADTQNRIKELESKLKR